MPLTLPIPVVQLFSALLSDSLDACGVTGQAMGPSIRPLQSELVMCGRARTAAYMEVCDVPEGHNPYALEIQLVDDLQADDIAVLACGGSQKIAPWGGLLSTASQIRGAAGCITDGFIRDTKTIKDINFPVFHGGIAPLDSRGRGEIQVLDRPIVCGGVKVSPGDLVFGDADGVVVIPKAVEPQVFAYAKEKISGESKTLNALRAGASLKSVYDKYGVL